jgi:RES domain-containing protein
MDVYRISRSRFVRDLSGEGPRLYGGRWNHKGTAVIYAATTRSLATLEYLVHVPLPYEPLHLSIAALVIPDDASDEVVLPEELPADWSSYPAPTALADIGTDWVRRGESLILRVPSALVPEEHNVIINPSHSEMARVTIKDVRAYAFDERLIQRKKREA